MNLESHQAAFATPIDSIDSEGSRTLVELAYKALRTDIISAHRQAGERLRIDRLKTLYGVGPTPLREALQRLSVDGLVLALGNRGFMVAPLDADEFLDLNRARIAIEIQALGMAIENGDAEWESQVAGAAYRLAKVDASLKSADESPMAAWAVANSAFHLACVAACGSNWLLKVRATIDAQCERYRHASVDMKRLERDLEAEHRAIAQAVLDRASESACSLVSDHYCRTADVLVAELSR